MNPVNKRRVILLCCMALIVPAAAGVADQGGDAPPPLERVKKFPDRMPPTVLAHMAAYTREAGDGRGFITAANLAWSGRVVRVAFVKTDGLDHSKLYRLIESAAAEWTQAGTGFNFSFKDYGVYRTWPSNDRAPVPVIRIAFSKTGSWSLIGKQALGSDIQPSEPTMNLDFESDPESYSDERDPAWLDSNDRLTILHEFGHALGLGHEHYHVQCQADLKFDADPGYVASVAPAPGNSPPEYVPDAQNRSPGLYKAMAGWPNQWSADNTLFNYDWPTFSTRTGLALRKALQRQQVSDPGFVQSAMIDQSSVMLYEIPAFLLKSGRKSRCLRPAQPGPVRLSAMDKQAYLNLYTR